LHRQLYDPSSGRGRQGLLELRALKWRPIQHALLQQLLVRTLVAHLYKAPLQSNLVRWGTRLHDQFFFTLYLWDDLSHVLEDLRRDGFPLSWNGSELILIFRFPSCGKVVIDGAELEIAPRWNRGRFWAKKPSGRP